MMKRLILLIILIVCIDNNCFCKSSISETEQLTVLFIGSSYFNIDNLPGLVNDLALSAGKDVFIDQYMPSGLYLADHVENIKSLAKINEQDWDYIILQGVGSITAYPEAYTPSDYVYQALLDLKELIFDNCPTTKMIFCLPWAYEDGMSWLEGWTDLFKDMQLKINTNTLLYSNQIGFGIAPVGWAWLNVLEDKNYPLHYLHLSDWNHPSLRGSYLMACVIYSTIYQETTVGNSFYSALPVGEAIYFQDAGSSAVLDNLGLWNLPEISTGIQNQKLSDCLSLDQNFPNPFFSSTQIDYEIKKGGVVEISLYNQYGSISRTLVKEYKLPGTYSINLGGTSLPSGIYYYSIKSGNEILTRKILVMN